MSPRLAARAVIVHERRLLIVNAYPGRDDLWCAPGGGIEKHQSVPDNLVREVHEETGLTVVPGELVLVNEFHAPDHDFHQVELFFRAALSAGDRTDAGSLDAGWRDPAGVVAHRRWIDEAEARRGDVRIKPSSLVDVAFGPPGPPRYDELETIVP
ncbi:MAG: NUDIX domain-containing protein [Acidimicrobiales bacterium]